MLLRRWVVLIGLGVLLAFSLKAAFGEGSASLGGSAPGASATGKARPGGGAASRGATALGTESAAQPSALSPELMVSEAPWHLQAPVSRAVVVDDGTHLVVLGGLQTGDTSTGDIWSIDPASGTVTERGTLQTPVHDSAGAFLGGRADVFGGGSYSTLATVQGWSPASRATTAVGSLPVARSDLSAVTVGGRAYVLGGYDGSALDPDILETTDGVHFRRVGELVRGVRYAATAALAGSIYVVGGELGTTETALSGGQTNAIQRFDPATGKTSIVGHLPITLGHASAVALGGELYVIGGRTGTALNAQMFRIDPATGAVTDAGALAYPRSDAAVATLGSSAYLIGGETSGPSAPLDSVLEVQLAPGQPSLPASENLYAADGPDMLSPVVRNVPYRIYVPESSGSDVAVIDPYTYQVIDSYETGLGPQHVIPAWNLKTIYAANDLGNSLTPISPYTGKPEGPNIGLPDPYNLYFTPNGRYAIVVEEADQTLAFRNPKTFALVKAVPVDCPGVDHGDFSADGSFAVFSCEFSSKMVKIDLKTLTVAAYLTIPGSSPQDVKLDPSGTVFYTADHNRGGVYLISAKTFKVIGFIPTGADAHGLYVSRDGRDLYVTNRGNGTISVIDLATRKVVQTWTIPGGGSPDMGNLSPDGTVLWVSGRYNACVYAISTVTGKLLAEIPVPDMPHGLLVWPQPGRYSTGHTGIMR